MRKVDESYEPVEREYGPEKPTYTVGIVAAALLVVGGSLFWWTRLRD